MRMEDLPLWQQPQANDVPFGQMIDAILAMSPEQSRVALCTLFGRDAVLCGEMIAAAMSFDGMRAAFAATAAADKAAEACGAADSYAYGCTDDTCYGHGDTERIGS